VPIVLDASVALAICFRDEQTEEVRAIARGLAEDPAHAPGNWPLEVGNGLLIAERRGRLTEADLAEARARVAALPVVIDCASLDRTLGPVLGLARDYKFTVYDAAYLELAARDAMPLATLDSELRAAALKYGVELAL
jgi:predicted nucleic acid-binding protein